MVYIPVAPMSRPVTMSCYVSIPAWMGLQHDHNNLAWAAILLSACSFWGTCVVCKASSNGLRPPFSYLGVASPAGTNSKTGCDIVTGTRYKPRVSYSSLNYSFHSYQSACLSPSPFHFAFQICLSTPGRSLRLELQAKACQQRRKLLGTVAV